VTTHTSAQPVETSAPAAQGQWRLAAERLRRDRLAVISGLLLAAIVVMCFVVGPVLARMTHHGPDTIFSDSVRDFQPVGFWTHVPNAHYTGEHSGGTTLFVLGADSTVGRDEFMRLLYGGQVTIEVALVATVLAMLIGTTLGALAGYRGGRIDGAIVWVTDFALAFPVLLVAIALGANLSVEYANFTLGGLLQPGVLTISVFLGLFAWMYPARLTRVQVLELRGRPFVEAARMAGAGGGRILRSHIVPHVIPTLIPPATVMFAGIMLLQASLSMLGVGIDPNTPSWGGMLALKVGWLTNLSTGESFSMLDPLVIYPTVAILLTAGTAAVFGEQVRKALNPRGT
jgi:peptide/nickel transport system permease protein